jgi:RNA polymerase sigma-70 factor (ECF subfamily)
MLWGSERARYNPTGVATDEELLDAWRDGDRAAGNELIERHFAPICRFFRSKLGDDVEDLIQRTFLDCVESRGRIAGPTFRSWLFAVARNRLFDHLREGLRRPVDDLGSRSIADLRTQGSGLMARAEERELVVQAMDALPLDFRITLELAYWEGLDGAEVAAALGVSPHTVRSRLSRARKLLEDELAALRGGKNE